MTTMTMAEARKIAESALGGHGRPSREDVAAALAKLAGSTAVDAGWLLTQLEQWQDRRPPEYEPGPAGATPADLDRAAAELEADYAADERHEERPTARTGRPPIGEPINLRLPAVMLADIDATARAEGVTRSQWIRQAVAARLHTARR